ncbi:hypothetical protein HPT25_26340 [Bacillus sp. BRMEA1]|uniref:hypothetical protein n=1 Tax=Neobacillus endophyticus TaxID=2738405 RepID=UPI0015675C3F|nr:hypothetical protein [Neobacillus endophyticus]NRD80851.1 hypothetical protein [Neobacillus endophyticus]
MYITLSDLYLIKKSLESKKSSNEAIIVVDFQDRLTGSKHRMNEESIKETKSELENIKELLDSVEQEIGYLEYRQLDGIYTVDYLEVEQNNLRVAFKK